MYIENAPSPNYFNGRNGKPIIAIVNHITAGNYPGCLTWMRNPQARASGHYLVTRKGRVFRLVEDKNAAWHAGFLNKPKWKLNDSTNPNYRTIGIEHEALSGQGLTEEQYQATLELHRILVKQYNIPIDRDHILGHCDIDSVTRVNDPGNAFPWDRLYADLKKHNYRVVPVAVSNQVVNGLLINETTYVPVRQIAVALSQTIQWNDDLNVVIIGKPTVALKAAPDGSANVAVKDKLLEAIIINDLSYIPVRPFAESLGRIVDWDGMAQRVNIL